MHPLRPQSPSTMSKWMNLFLFSFSLNGTILSLISYGTDKNNRQKQKNKKKRRKKLISFYRNWPKQLNGLERTKCTTMAVMTAQWSQLMPGKVWINVDRNGDNKMRDYVWEKCWRRFHKNKGRNEDLDEPTFIAPRRPARLSARRNGECPRWLPQPSVKCRYI